MELAGERPVENAEDAGLIRIGRDGRALTVRYAHPFRRVIRKRLGFAASRRLQSKLSPHCVPVRCVRPRIVSGRRIGLRVMPTPIPSCSPRLPGIR